jgi:F-type H+-transporting ATPase subunit a
MALTLVLLAWVARTYQSPRATRTQTITEGTVNYIADLVASVLGKQGEPFVPFFISLFIFIFMLNQFGIFPFKILGLQFGGAPTADLNTTLPLALMVFFLTWAVALRKNGLGAFGHLAKPFVWLLPINTLEELARPATLAARLFFNIFVGELLYLIIAQIVTAGVHVGSFNLSLAAAILPFFIQFFNFFVGTIQAFVFTLLGIVYLSLAVGEEAH